MNMSENSEGTSKMLYEEMCRQHDGIQDFRAKLLGFLPFASGVGIFLLVNSNGKPKDFSPDLLAIGVFGILVTIGLFVYELRGIEKCVALIEAARKLEDRATELSPALNGLKGAFQSKPLTLEMRQPALIIYSAVVLAWAYMAAVGAASLSMKVPINDVARISVALAVTLGFLSLGWWELKKPRYRLKDEKETSSG
jgi:hypothetical protein